MASKIIEIFRHVRIKYITNPSSMELEITADGTTYFQIDSTEEMEHLLDYKQWVLKQLFMYLREELLERDEKIRTTENLKLIISSIPMSEREKLGDELIDIMDKVDLTDPDSVKKLLGYALDDLEGIKNENENSNEKAESKTGSTLPVL